MKRLAALLSLLIASTAVAQTLDSPGEPTAAQPPLPTQKIIVVSKSGARHSFDAEMAVTPIEQRVGLMFRNAIAADRGMFFDWGLPAHEQAMWMENCPVPEDMVFIGTDGAIIHIAEDTVPYSTANIASGGAVRATLELQGGITEKLGISVGDHIYGPVFGAAPK